jgi:NAD(P)-dependent dehydrogenase (short-subunit alcohol dehydrogenase family)
MNNGKINRGSTNTVPAKTFIVTGGNTGLGFECASALAEDGNVLVVIACRDVQKGEEAAQSVRKAGGDVKVLPLDLARLESIHAFVAAFRQSQFPPLAGVVCNAGGQNVAAPTKTKEGYETTFAVNHLGHYLLIRLLLPDFATGASITFVSSGTHDPKQKTGMPEPMYINAQAVAHDFELGGNAGRRRYTTSKLCNVFCTYEYDRRLAASQDTRLQSLRVNAFDPGLMPATDLARTYPAPLRFVSRYILPTLSLFVSNIHSPAKSGRRLALLASGAGGLVTGKYFSDGREIRSSEASYDTQNALDLWNASADMTGLPSELSVGTLHMA